MESRRGVDHRLEGHDDGVGLLRTRRRTAASTTALGHHRPSDGPSSVAQNWGIALNSVKADVEGDMDLSGILGADPDVRNGFSAIRVRYTIDADAERPDIEAVVAQSQKRSAVYDVIANPTSIVVDVA